MAKDYMKTLFDNMDQEQEKYREWLLQQPPETILDHAYQYAVREDIIMAFSESDFELDQDQAGALLTRKSPLQTLLNDYTKLDSNVSTTLREVAEERANAILQSYRETPVYLHTYGYAKSTGQESLYHTSHEANIKCRNAIEQAISDNYQDNRLHTEEAVKEVADIYGYDRPLYVLAVTVRAHLWDGRFGRETKTWAEEAPAAEGGPDAERQYVIEKTHPGLVQMFTSRFREQAREKVAEQIAAIPLNAAAYQELKDGHPGKVAGVLTGGHVMFYGEDARTAAQALGTKVLDADVPGLGQIETTGSSLNWQSVLKKLMDHNIPVVLARQDPESGVDSPYLVVKEREKVATDGRGYDIPLEADSFSIYQIKQDPELLVYCFQTYEKLQKDGLGVDPSCYERVYTGPLREGETLEDLYAEFNLAIPEDFRGHSMSVSDVVVLHQNGEDTAYYCNMVGFREVPEFLSRELAPTTHELKAEVETWEAQQAAQKQALIDTLSERQKLIVQAWETAGFTFSPQQGGKPVFTDGVGFPLAFNNWEEAYEKIDNAQLLDTPGLREQVQNVLHPERENAEQEEEMEL